MESTRSGQGLVSLVISYTLLLSLLSDPVQCILSHRPTKHFRGTLLISSFYSCEWAEATAPLVHFLRCFKVFDGFNCILQLIESWQRRKSFRWLYQMKESYDLPQW